MPEEYVKKSQYNKLMERTENLKKSNRKLSVEKRVLKDRIEQLERELEHTDNPSEVHQLELRNTHLASRVNTLQKQVRKLDKIQKVLNGEEL